MFLQKKSKYDHVIVGLGNPGLKYESTRHNAGFRAIDIFAKSIGASIEKNKFQALVGEATVDGKKILLVKPQTFMNDSGASVGEIMSFYKQPVSTLAVISDDVTIDAGRLRIRPQGSHGGHNGLRDIIEVLGSDEFVRIKIGMGQKPHPDCDLADWVLGKPSEEDRKKTDKAESDAADAVLTLIKCGTERAMNSFNR